MKSSQVGPTFCRENYSSVLFHFAAIRNADEAEFLQTKGRKETENFKLKVRYKVFNLGDFGKIGIFNSHLLYPLMAAYGLDLFYPRLFSSSFDDEYRQFYKPCLPREKQIVPSDLYSSSFDIFHPAE